MTTLKQTRAAQYPLAAVFQFNITDDMVNTSGVDTAFKAASGTVYDVIPVPAGWRVSGGALVVDTVSNDSSTATLAVGDSGSANRYLTATSIKSAARTALVPTGFISVGNPIRITLANAGGDATAGKVTLYVELVSDTRANEAINTSQVTK